MESHPGEHYRQIFQDDDSDWVTDNDSVMGDDGESDE
jgi:hypothetical protein